MPKREKMNRRKIKGLITALCALLTALTVRAGNVEALKDTVYGVGIDISHYNNEPDWEQIEVDFVIMKATEGGTYTDPTFKSRLEKCRKAGIKAGAYHYYRGSVPTEKEFNNFKNAVGHDIDIIPMVDIEKMPEGVTKDQFVSKLLDFISMIEREYGAVPIIYAKPAFYIENLQDIIETNWPDHLYWLGEGWQPYEEYGINASIHQAQIRNIKGVRGKVDYDELHCPLERILLKK